MGSRKYRMTASRSFTSEMATGISCFASSCPSSHPVKASEAFSSAVSEESPISCANGTNRSTLLWLSSRTTSAAIGAASFPETHIHATDAESDLRYTKEKVDAGAQFLITQLFFDNRVYWDFVALAREIEDHVLWRPESDSALEGSPNKFVVSK